MKLKRALVAALGVALLIPSLALGADLNLNLKDNQGASFTDLSGVTVRLLDGVGSLVQEVVAPASATVSFTGLASQESYTAITKYSKTQAVDQNGNVIIDSASSKSIRFETDTETLSRDVFVYNPVASNVLVRISNVPATWTSGKAILTPVESSRSQIDATSLTFSGTPASGIVELTIPAMPAMKYSAVLANQDGSETFAVEGTKTARNNGTLSFNTNLAKSPAISFNITLKNPDRTVANFAGETINIEVKDSANAVVYTKTLTGSGAAATDTTPVLSNAEYTVKTTVSNGTLTRESTKTVSLVSGPKTSNISFSAFSPVNVDLLIRDSRSGANLATGSIIIKDSAGNTLETVSLTGSSITKSLVYGYPYKLEISSTGYTTKAVTLYPRENSTREITLFKQL